MAITAEGVITALVDKAGEAATTKTNVGSANSADVQTFNNAMQSNSTSSPTGSSKPVSAGQGMVAQQAPSALQVNLAGSLQVAAHNTKPTIGDKILSKLDKLRKKASGDMQAINALLESDELTLSDSYQIQYKMNSQMVMYELVSQIAGALSRHAHTMLTAQ